VGWRRYRKPVIGSVLVIGLALTAWLLRESWSIDEVKQWVLSLGLWGPLAFGVIYALATVLFIPGPALTLGGGAMFGPVFGTFYNLTAATIGATIAFVIARYVAADWVEKRSAGGLLKIKHGVEAEGWRFVVFVRLVPLFPFNLLNYALGLTRIPLLQYVIASYIAMLPGAFLHLSRPCGRRGAGWSRHPQWRSGSAGVAGGGGISAGVYQTLAFRSAGARRSVLITFDVVLGMAGRVYFLGS